MRHVFPTSEIPHKWAHQTQADARNPQGNLYFKGPTIYSYRDSWPLARIYEKRKGAMSRCSVGGSGRLLDSTVRTAMQESGVLVLTNSDKYGNTTAGHQHAVNQAVRHLPRIAVPEVDLISFGYGQKEKNLRHSRNLAYLATEQERLLKEAGRVMSEHGVQWRADAAGQLHKAYCDYLIFFGIRRKAPALLSFAAAFERARRIETPDPVKDARKIKQREQRSAKVRAELQGAFDAYCARVSAYNAQILAQRAAMPDAAEYWRANGKWPDANNSDITRPYLGYKERRKMQNAGFVAPETENLWNRAESVLLRVDGEQIVTSMGARIPLAAAPMVWTAVQRQVAKGQARDFGANRALGRPMVGDYPLDRIEADGTLVVGCHTIPYSELAMMARQLRLVS